MVVLLLFWMVLADLLPQTLQILVVMMVNHLLCTNNFPMNSALTVKIIINVLLVYDLTYFLQMWTRASPLIGLLFGFWVIKVIIACSTCFGNHYAHHQELKSIIQWLLPVVFCAVVFKLLQHPANQTHNP